MTPSTRLRQALLALILAILVGARPASAADFPCPEAHLVVPWGTGSGSDVIARAFVDVINASGAKPELQVKNVRGANGKKGTDEVRAAAPDGCTLLLAHQSLYTTYFSGESDYHWQAFSPVALLTRTPWVLASDRMAPFETFDGLVQISRTAPKNVNVAVNPGSIEHFDLMMLEHSLDIRLDYKPIESARERLLAMLDGAVNAAFVSVSAAQRYHDYKEVNLLAVTSAEPVNVLPTAPLVRDFGYSYTAGIERGIMLPPKAKKEVLDHYVKLFQTAAASPGLAGELAGSGTEIVFQASGQYRLHLEDMFAEWRNRARDAGLYAD